jgi:hypothetical protein
LFGELPHINKERRRKESCMKILLEHELPRKLRYARVYLEVGNASLYVSVDGSRASWFGSIGGRTRGAVSISDSEYSRYRAATPATELIDEEKGKVILRNKEGFEEEWSMPRWVLTGFRRSKDKSREK